MLSYILVNGIPGSCIKIDMFLRPPTGIETAPFSVLTIIGKQYSPRSLKTPPSSVVPLPVTTSPTIVSAVRIGSLTAGEPSGWRTWTSMSNDVNSPGGSFASPRLTRSPRANAIPTVYHDFTILPSRSGLPTPYFIPTCPSTCLYALGPNGTATSSRSAADQRSPHRDQQRHPCHQGHPPSRQPVQDHWHHRRPHQVPGADPARISQDNADNRRITKEPRKEMKLLQPIRHQGG
jgi:hypothetical protein